MTTPTIAMETPSGAIFSKNVEGNDLRAATRTHQSPLSVTDGAKNERHSVD